MWLLHNFPLESDIPSWTSRQGLKLNTSKSEYKYNSLLKPILPGDLPLFVLPIILVVVQSLGRVRHFAIPWTAAHQASLSFTISHGLHKLMSIILDLKLKKISPNFLSFNQTTNHLIIITVSIYQSAAHDMHYVIFFFFFKFLLTVPQGIWDLDSLTRDRTHIPCVGRAES